MQSKFVDISWTDVIGQINAWCDNPTLDLKDIYKVQ